VEQYLSFEKKHNVEWLAGEKIVCSQRHLVAGRVDDIALVNGKLSVVDKKTSSRISETYFLQTAGYMMALKEMGVLIEQRIILRLPKDEKDSFQAALVTTPYEKDIEAFLHLRYAREWDNYIDCKFKEKIKVGKYLQEKLIITEL
jgi:predicted RecB family nuclease